jgi:MoaA/NifB/PqqE/SkfB family radical SAM enzyme
MYIGTVNHPAEQEESAMSMNTQFVQLAFSNAAKYGRQRLSSWTGSMLSQPTSVFASMTNRCNLHCTQCDIPLLGDRKTELSTEDWMRVIRDLKGWLGTTLIRWSGGEPFVRRDMIDVIEYSSSIGVLTGVNTNGHYIDDKMADRMVRANVFNTNLSLDGMQHGHDFVRGAGQFERVTAAARRLNRLRRERKASMRIIIKVTIMQTNLDELLPLADGVEEEGLDALSISPLEQTFATAVPDPRWFEKSTLWVRDLDKLDRVIDGLIARTGSQGPVFNSRSHLESMKGYFRDPNLPTPPDFKCHVGNDHFRISATGDVVMCPFMGPIGNVSSTHPREIWESHVASQRRDDVNRCRKKCLIGCLYKRDIKEYADVLFKLV